MKSFQKVKFAKERLRDGQVGCGRDIVWRCSPEADGRNRLCSRYILQNGHNPCGARVSGAVDATALHAFQVFISGGRAANLDWSRVWHLRRQRAKYHDVLNVT